MRSIAFVALVLGCVVVPAIAEEGRSVAGRVVDDQGQPVAGARLSQFVRPDPGEVLTAGKFVGKFVEVGQSAADGTFRVQVSDQGGARRAALVAQHQGFGPDWVMLNSAFDGGDLTLRLAPDLPIQGRVLDADGQPIEGVTVAARSLMQPVDGNADRFLEAWKKDYRDSFSSVPKQLFGGVNSLGLRATTGADGNFELRGAGAERVASVEFSGPKIALRSMYVVTRAGLEAGPYNEAALARDPPELQRLQLPPEISGPQIELRAETPVTIEGIVVDTDTRQPLADCLVTVHVGWGDTIHATSDREGAFRLTGILKKESGYRLHVIESAQLRADGKPTYLTRWLTVPDQEGHGPFLTDVELTKGAIVVGRILDKQTGEPVDSGVRLAPLADNKFFASKPGFDNYRSDRTMSGTQQGRFRIVTIPGRALLMVQAHGTAKYNGRHICYFRRAVPEPQDRALFKHDLEDDEWTINTAVGSEFLNVQNAVRVIDVKEQGETEVEIHVDRGMTAILEIHDDQDQPLAGAWVAGMTEHWPITYRVPETSATIYALDPSRARRVIVYHPERKLAGIATVRGDEQQPLVAKLEPLGSVRGRLLDADGQPLAGMRVEIDPRGLMGRELYRFATGAEPEPVIADANGAFRIDGIVAGMKFYLGLQRDGKYFTGKPRIGDLETSPGGLLDVGDKTIVPR